ncbi:MBL fold metallo-hydrolase [Paracoccaceae bacterium GXU_MW_L88]
MLYKIGDVEIWRVLDLLAPFMPPEELFPTVGPDVTEIIERHAPGTYDAASGKLIFPFQGFLLKTPSHVILVDSCVGNHKTHPKKAIWHQRDSGRFMAALKAADVAPEDVDYVLCTHLHADHIGWNTQLVDGRWVPTFPKARYILPKADEAALKSADDLRYTESVLPVIAAGQAEFVEREHPLGDHVTLMPTPGHTPGHVSVLITSGGREAVITGDAIHMAAQCQHPDWHFKFDADPEEAVTSRRTLLASSAEAQRVVVGSHFALPSIGRVAEDGDAFSWENL